MRTNRRLAVALALLGALAGPAAAEVYRCEVDGATVYSDRPCKPDAKPVKVQPNTVGEVDQKAAAAQRKALDVRLNAGIELDVAQRELDRARFDAKRAECGRYADDIRRQSVWLGDFYLGASAEAEIAIAKRKAAEAGC